MGESIGSELARLALRLGAKSIILYERNEHALYQIESELIENSTKSEHKPDIFAILGSVTDGNRVASVFEVKSKIVFHAAAFKHVPMIEKNVLQGLFNNTINRIIAQAAHKSNIDRFILVSTDKAVRPTSVMGATKRFAELCIQNLSKESKTIFSIVRFGNVLGSSGSVIPLFDKQIKSGGPVTVTHPDVNRFFMTISEAASLVIQSNAMATGGEVLVLDMGAPVKILDVAKSMIRLMVLKRKFKNPNGDIEILFTGLRPGEKLYEGY